MNNQKIGQLYDQMNDQENDQMNGQINDEKNSQINEEKKDLINEDSFNPSQSRIFGFPLIFILNLLQSLFFLFLFILAFIVDNVNVGYKKGEKKKNYEVIEIIVVLAIILFIGKKVFEKKCQHCCCAIILIIIFFFFKFTFILFSIGWINVEVFHESIHGSAFIYWNAATSLFYIGCFISCYIKKDISLLLYFLIGLSSSIIFFIPAYFHSHDIISAGIFSGLTFTEVIFFLGSIFYAQHNLNLEEGESLNNFVIIDNYKYFIVLIIFTLAIFLMFMLLCCVIGMISGKETPYYKDQFGNLYNINKERIY